MISRSSIITSGLCLTVTALAACGSSDVDVADGPENAYVRLADGAGTEKEGSVWYLTGDAATFTWTAHGAAADGEPTVVRVRRLDGPCDVARGASCPEGSELEERTAEEVELPADGSEKTGDVTISDLEPGTRTRLLVSVCNDDACQPGAVRTVRRTT